MSSDLVHQLQRELADLRSDLLRFHDRADSIEARLHEVTAGDFEVVPSAGGSTSYTGSSSAARTVVAASDTEGRLQLAREIGQFLRRCLDGRPRGSSGRDRLNLQNRYYIILADFDGVNLPEPLFVDSFARVKELCKRGPAAGKSVFVGLATRWEAKVVFEAASLRVPEALRDA